MHRRIARFERRMRAEFGPMPYVVVLERHKTGAIHAHVALPATFLEHARFARVWGYGHVFYADRKRKRLVGRRVAGRRFQARSMAGYLAKYVSKDPVRVGPTGHRYEVAEGFQPKAVRRSAGSLGAGIEFVRQTFELGAGEVLDLIWDSSQAEDWRGPPVRYMRYEEAA
jgi:hypothetical protein